MSKRARAIALARQGGLSQREIARQVSVHCRTVQRWLSPEHSAMLDARAREKRLARRRRLAAARRKRQRQAEAYVPVEPLREAVQRSLVPRAVICRELGWVRTSKGRVIDDTRRLARSLGEIPYGGEKNRHTVKQRVRVDTALAVIHAINLDPVDLGI